MRHSSSEQLKAAPVLHAVCSGGSLRPNARFVTTIKELSRVTGLTVRSLKNAVKRAGLSPMPSVLGRRQLAAILQEAFVSAARPESPFSRSRN